MKEFLVYTSAGENCNVAQWCKGEDATFDIWLTNYSNKDSLWSEYCDEYEQRKGGKFANLYHLFIANESKLKNYSYIMVLDDDIVISTEKLNGLFALAKSRNFDAVAPALSRMGKISHEGTERQLLSSFRLTNFIEMNCPLFKSDIIKQFIFDEYNPDSLRGFGEDWWYLDYMRKLKRTNIAISDEHFCINPHDFKKIGNQREFATLAEGADYIAMFRKLKQARGIEQFDLAYQPGAPKKFSCVVKDAPFFLWELLFQFLLKSKYTHPFRRLAKTVLGRN